MDMKHLLPKGFSWVLDHDFVRSKIFGNSTIEAEGSIIEDGWISTAEEGINLDQSHDQVLVCSMVGACDMLD